MLAMHVYEETWMSEMAEAHAPAQVIIRLSFPWALSSLVVMAIGRLHRLCLLLLGTFAI